MTETSTFRRVAVALTIGSFSIAALMGIVALLSGGDFGEGQVKVLLTTLIVGCASICMLCYLATTGTLWFPFGVVGGVALTVPVVTSLVLVWHDWEEFFPEEGWLKWFGVGTVLAVTMAQVCLLLALAWTRPGLRFVLWVTNALALLLAVIVSGVILNEDEADGLWRLIGTIAILDVLGTLVTIALAKFGRGDDSRRVDDSAKLPPALEARLAERAAQLGRSRASVLAEAVERFLQTEG